MHRRQFLQTTGLASAALFLPAFLRAGLPAFTAGQSGRRLIIIQLSGGNDGLNCIVPFRDDRYYAARPTIGLSGKSLLRLDDQAAFNAQLRGLADLYHDGKLSIINSIGYPNPNRSHFRSLDIWHSGSDSGSYVQTGWIGRYLDHRCIGECPPAHAALEVDDSLSLALKGELRKGMATRDPIDLRQNADRPLLRYFAGQAPGVSGERMFLYKTLRDTLESAEYLAERTGKGKTTGKYPDHAFGKQLRLIAGLIGAGCDTAVYYVSLPGFDTHALQKNIQHRLLRIYSEGVSALVHDLRNFRQFDDTLIFTFSEFGRRVAQNGSNGTDHGAANVAFLAGGGLREHGLINGLPDLGDLDDGDLRFKTDFRTVYASLLDQWLGADADAILGRNFGRLPLAKPQG
jgi:uncharacterized protein (DUF1501 family)